MSDNPTKSTFDNIRELHSAMVRAERNYETMTSDQTGRFTRKDINDAIKRSDAADIAYWTEVEAVCRRAEDVELSEASNAMTDMVMKLFRATAGGEELEIAVSEIMRLRNGLVRATVDMKARAEHAETNETELVDRINSVTVAFGEEAATNYRAARKWRSAARRQWRKRQALRKEQDRTKAVVEAAREVAHYSWDERHNYAKSAHEDLQVACTAWKDKQ